MGMGRGYGPAAESDMDKRKSKELVRRLSDVLFEILAEGAPAAKETVASKKKPGRKSHLIPVLSLKAKSVKVKAKAKGKAKGKARKASRAGGAELKPCPVTGILNKHRRFSYLMPEARTAENLAKFKGASKKSAAQAAA